MNIKVWNVGSPCKILIKYSKNIRVYLFIFWDGAHSPDP